MLSYRIVLAFFLYASYLLFSFCHFGLCCYASLGGGLMWAPDVGVDWLETGRAEGPLMPPSSHLKHILPDILVFSCFFWLLWTEAAAYFGQIRWARLFARIQKNSLILKFAFVCFWQIEACASWGYGARGRRELENWTKLISFISIFSPDTHQKRIRVNPLDSHC